MVRGNDIIWVEKAKALAAPNCKSNVLPKKTSWLARLSLLLQQPPLGMEHTGWGQGRDASQLHALITFTLEPFPLCFSSHISPQRRRAALLRLP